MKIRTLIPLAIACASACLATEQPTTSASPAAATAAPAVTARPFRVHVLPPGAYERLNLSPDQAKAVAVLEAQTTASLQAILTAEQLQQLRQMHPPHGHGPGGQGGNPPPPPPAE